jgi:hypothetical protein
MNTDRDLAEAAARRRRGRRLAWIAAGVGVLTTLIVLAPAPAGTRDSDPLNSARRLLERAAPALPQHFASLSDQIDWDAREPAGDPSPLSVAAYER